jgi:hypothetical protein
MRLLPDPLRPGVQGVLSLVLALLVVASACSSSDDEASDDAIESGAAEEAFEGGDDMDRQSDVDVAAADEAGAAPEAPSDGPGSGGLSDTAGLPVVDTGRDIIFTATVSVEVEDVVSAGQEATTAIQGLGGVLFGQITTSEGVPRSTLTFKVAPGDFQTALSRLGDIGFLRDQVITADDVTERVVDLESQIITAELSVERLRGFLESATNLTEIADIEQQLLTRETSLERLRGQLRTIQGQVSLATITVTFTQRLPGPEVTVEQTAYLGHDDGTTCPGLDELSADEGEPITVCYRITNSGDTALGEIDVRDDGLGLERDDLELVDGSLDQPLVVGASVTLAAEIEAPVTGQGRAQVTALPVSSGGTDLLLGRVAGRDDLELDIAEDTSLPGFLDGLSTGVAVVLRIVEVLVLAAGFLLPFIWVLPLLWLGRRRLGRRRAAKLPPPPWASTPSAPISDPRAGAGSVERGQGAEAEG